MLRRHRESRLAVALLIAAANAACGGKAITADQTSGSGTGGMAGAGGLSGGSGGLGGSSGTSAPSGVTGVAAGPACGVIRASDYNQSCESAHDCAGVLEGDTCANPCVCPNATINKAALANYHPVFVGPPPMCVCPDFGTPSCVGGVCTMCPPAGCPAKDGGTAGTGGMGSTGGAYWDGQTFEVGDARPSDEAVTFTCDTSPVDGGCNCALGNAMLWCSVDCSTHLTGPCAPEGLLCGNGCSMSGSCTCRTGQWFCISKCL
jgi:hypothetical protein